MKRHISFVFAGLVALGAALAGPVGAQTAPAATTAARLEGEDMVIGAPDAKITIVEYASLTCPHCAAFHAEVLPKLKTEFVDTGVVKFVYRDFPLDRVALTTAQIARCLPPERYFGFLDALFRQQESWASGRDGEAMVAKVKQLARLAGLSTEKADACVADPEKQAKVANMRFAGEKEFDIRGTPTLIINGRKYTGSMEFVDLDKFLKSLAGRS